MKTLVSFVFVYTSQMKVFADFDRGAGLYHLVAVLEKIEARVKKNASEKERTDTEIITADEQTPIGNTLGENAHCNQGVGIHQDESIEEHSTANKKRKIEDEDDGVVTAKKSRLLQ